MKFLLLEFLLLLVTVNGIFGIDGLSNESSAENIGTIQTKILNNIQKLDFDLNKVRTDISNEVKNNVLNVHKISGNIIKFFWDNLKNLPENNKQAFLILLAKSIAEKNVKRVEQPLKQLTRDIKDVDVEKLMKKVDKTIEIMNDKKTTELIDLLGELKSPDYELNLVDLISDIQKLSGIAMNKSDIFLLEFKILVEQTQKLNTYNNVYDDILNITNNTDTVGIDKNVHETSKLIIKVLNDDELKPLFDSIYNIAELVINNLITENEQIVLESIFKEAVSVLETTNTKIESYKPTNKLLKIQSITTHVNTIQTEIETTVINELRKETTVNSDETKDITNKGSGKFLFWKMCITFLILVLLVNL